MVYVGRDEHAKVTFAFYYKEGVLTRVERIDFKSGGRRTLTDMPHIVEKEKAVWHIEEVAREADEWWRELRLEEKIEVYRGRSSADARGS